MTGWGGVETGHWGGGWRQVSDGRGGGWRQVSDGGVGVETVFQPVLPQVSEGKVQHSHRHLKVTNFSQYYHRYLKVRYQQCHRRLKITNISQQCHGYLKVRCQHCHRHSKVRPVSTGTSIGSRNLSLSVSLAPDGKNHYRPTLPQFRSDQFSSRWYLCDRKARMLLVSEKFPQRCL